MYSNNNLTCSASVFDATQPIPNLTEEQIKSCLGNITVLNCKEIDALRQCILNDIESYKSTSEWHDIKNILNTPPFANVTVSSEVSDKADELTDILSTYRLRKWKDEGFYSEGADCPYHAIDSENLTSAVLYCAREKCDGYFVDYAVRNAQKIAKAEYASFNKKNFIETFNPKQLCEEAGFGERYKQQLNKEVRHVASSYADILREFAQHTVATAEDHRQRILYSAVGAMPLYHLNSIESTHFLTSLYHHTNHTKRNDVYGLLLAMRENVSKPTSQQEVSSVDEANYLTDNKKYFSFGVDSCAGKENKYFNANEELYQAASVGNLPLVKDILLDEFSDFESDKSITTDIDRALDRKALKCNGYDTAERFSKAWKGVYGSIIDSLEQEYNSAENAEDAPWCYFEALCDREEGDKRIEIVDRELLEEFTNLFVKTHGECRSLLYKLMYMINYVKEKQGYVRSTTKDFDSSRVDENKTVEAIIQFLDPILNNSVINPRAFSVDGFIGMIKLILKNKYFSYKLDTVSEHYKKQNVCFNLEVVYQILCTLMWKTPPAEKGERGMPYHCPNGSEIFLLKTPTNLDRAIRQSEEDSNWRKKMKVLNDPQKAEIYNIVEEIHSKDPLRLS